MNSNARAHAAYWVLVVVLFGAQAVVTWAGLAGLRYEELADFIRNPFWFDHRLVYDGTSANVAWYALLVVTYKIFGFSPYASKYLRLALHAPFLVCTALLLKESVGVRRGWLPLVAAGLSPTALYFNGVAYGIDLQLFPVVVWLMLRARGPGLRLAVGCAAMLGCLSYPSFLLYVPILLAFYIWLNRRAPLADLSAQLAVIAVGFAAPLIAAFVYLRNRSAFLSDPSVGGAGVFRGGGGATTIEPTDLAHGISQVFQDLFVRGSSYYFGLPHVEFSGLAGVAAAWGILVAALVVGWHWKAARTPMLFAAALCLVSIVVPSVSRHLPGLRRSTGFIAGAYVMVACVWAAPVPPGLRSVAVWIGKLACVLLIVHHVIVFRPNVHFLADEARLRDDPWFNQFGTPDESIRGWTEQWVMQGRPLACPPGRVCRFAEIYAAVASEMKWNGRGERPVLAVDPRTGAVTALDVTSFDAGGFPH